MKLLFTALLVLIFSVFLSVMARDDPGYVLINYHSWIIEVSVVFAVIIILVVFFIAYFALRFFVNSLRLPQRMQHWFKIKRMDRANVALTQGLLDLAKGDWRKAEKHLIRHVNNSQMPLLNYLAAAKAAQKQDNNERRDSYLQQAHKIMPKAELAIGLTQAELQINQGQLEQALATLTHLRQLAPKHVAILILLMRLYVELQDWQKLLELLPIIRKKKSITHEKSEELEVLAQVALLNKAATNEGAKELEEIWHRVSHALKKITFVVQAYVQGLIKFNQDKKAETLINKILKREWDVALIRQYGLLRNADCTHQIRQAEAWLDKHRYDAVLLLTLGRLCLRNQLWAQAREYLESSLAQEDSTEACAELAQLMEQQGDSVLALQYYRQGIQLTRSPIALLPAVELQSLTLSGSDVMASKK